MRLYLVRHGQAVERSVDPDRPLSDDGREEIEAVAAFIAEIGLEVAQIWHSAKLRARQTGEILNREGKLNAALVEQEGLGPNDDIGPVAKRINSSKSNILIAGHLPFLGSLASYLTTNDASALGLSFKTGAMLALERYGDSAWFIEWLIDPGLVRR